MKKGVLLTLIATLAIIASSRASYAQANIYAVKFVCGTQKPIASLTAPAEPPVKPANYATVLNIQSFNDVEGGLVIKTRISLANSGAASVPGPALDIAFLQTADVTCADIAAALKNVATNGFITGYVDVLSTSTIVVTSVYTSQGCTFPPLSNIAVLPTVCSGPTSIDVVPQQPVPLANGAAISG